MATKHSAEKVQSIKPEVIQPMTSAGSNLEAQESVGNVMLETDIEPEPSNDEIAALGEQSAEVTLAIDIARAAINGYPVGPLVAQAVALLPTAQDAAAQYCKTLLRMQMMAESVVRETRVAFYQKFGT